jgi:hypothetical protein
VVAGNEEQIDAPWFDQSGKPLFPLLKLFVPSTVREIARKNVEVWSRVVLVGGGLQSFRDPILFAEVINDAEVNRLTRGE